MVDEEEGKTAPEPAEAGSGAFLRPSLSFLPFSSALASPLFVFYPRAHF
jgi:hypothetical protein